MTVSLALNKPDILLMPDQDNLPLAARTIGGDDIVNFSSFEERSKFLKEIKEQIAVVTSHCNKHYPRAKADEVLTDPARKALQRLSLIKAIASKIEIATESVACVILNHSEDEHIISKLVQNIDTNYQVLQDHLENFNAIVAEDPEAENNTVGDEGEPSPEGEERLSPFDSYLTALVLLRMKMVGLEKDRSDFASVKGAVVPGEFTEANLENRGTAEIEYYKLLAEAEKEIGDLAALKVEVAKKVRENIAEDLEAYAAALERQLDGATKEQKGKIMKWVRRVDVAGALLYPSSVSENQQKVVDTSGGVPTVTDTAPAMPAAELGENNGIILPTIPPVATEAGAPTEAMPLERHDRHERDVLEAAAEAPTPTILSDFPPTLAYTLPLSPGSEANREAIERKTEAPSPTPLRPVEGVVGSAPSVATMPLTPVTGEFAGPSINLVSTAFPVPSLPLSESPMQRPERLTPLEEPPVAEVVSDIDTNPPLQAEFLTVQPGSTVSETMLQVFKAGGFNTYFTEQGITLTADEFVALFEKARLIFNADPERIRNEVRMNSGNLDLVGHNDDEQTSSSDFNAIPLVQEIAQLKKDGDLLTGDDIARAGSQSIEDVGTRDVVDADISTIPTTEVITGGETTGVVITSDKIADLAEAYPGGVDGYNKAFLAWVGTLQGSEVAGGYNWLSRMFGPSGFDAYSLFANFNNGNGMNLETLTSIMEGPDRDAKLRDLGIPARPAKLRANFENLYTMIMEVAKDPQLSVTPIMDLTYILWVAFAKEVMEKKAEGLSR